MYVCQCRGITDRTVRAAIIDGASTVEEIGRRCGAGVCCGGCHPELERLLVERAQRAEPAGSGWLARLTGTDGRRG